MEIAMLFAYWEGEPWSNPIGFINEFSSRGHSVTKFNCYHDDGKLPLDGSHRKYSAAGLLKLIQHYRDFGYRPDIVLNMDYGMYYVPFLGKSSISDALWILEAGDEPQSHRMNWEKAKLFDLILSPDYECNERYINIMKKHSVWFTHCADTSIFYPRENIKEDFDIVTTSGPRGYHHLSGLTERMKDHFGNRFENSRFYWGENHAKQLNRGGIVFQCSQYQEITRRVFEGMACGKMVLTDRLPPNTRIETLFEHERDIVYYDSIEDAIEKAEYYIKHEKERKAIADNGMKKVWENHSTMSRAETLENLVENFMSNRI